MEEVRISTVLGFLQELEKGSEEFDGLVLRDANLFRGVANNHEHKLIPAIGRNWSKGLDELLSLERSHLNLFKNLALPYIDYRPSNDWYWLMLGQHHGLETRLLDWTTNPLVALYFACNSENNLSEDGAVYRTSGIKLFDISKYDSLKLPNPFEIDQNYRVMTPHISPRITAQAATFTISKNPIEPLDLSALGTKGRTNDKIIVAADSKRRILRELLDLNIGPSSLFPGLDGLCRELREELSLFKKIILS